MRTPPALHFAAASLVLTASLSSVAALQSVTRQDADRFEQKLRVIERRGEQRSGPALRTPVTESEVNSYLALSSGWFMPAGVVGSRLSISGEDRVAGRAVVDLDEVRRAQKPGLLNPLNYLSGRVPVAAQGVIRAGGGVARFELESADVGGVPIPKRVLQEIVAYYTRSPDYPNGVNLDDPFPLPARIRAIEIRPREAIVVQ